MLNIFISSSPFQATQDHEIMKHVIKYLNVAILIPHVFKHLFVDFQFYLSNYIFK